jgi:hypothetical protein
MEANKEKHHRGCKHIQQIILADESITDAGIDIFGPHCSRGKAINDREIVTIINLRVDK